jgi:hypothetical protein
MLTNPQWSEQSQSVVTLHEDVHCQKAFPLLLKYLYRGEINLAVAQVLPILTLAEKYNVWELAKLCVGYMTDRIVCAASQNVLISW